MVSNKKRGMKHTLTAILCLVLLFSITACKKNKDAKADCYRDNAVRYEINNQLATVYQVNGEYYIAEQNTIDTRLFPCNLPEEFQQNNINIYITGQVKSLPYSNTRPAGDAALIITQITRR